MAEVGRQETPIFTWNPVEQMWVQERGGAAKPPPVPHDVHAIQTWFLDPDGNEWIQTVLGPMGRQLAAQWKGAYRVPEGAVAQKAKSPQKRSPLTFLVAGAVLLALIGGVAVAAPNLMNAPTATPAPSAPVAATAPSPVQPAPTAANPVEPAPTVAPVQPEPTAAPTRAPVATPRPVAPAPNRPAGPAVTFPNGTTVVYTGALSVNRGSYLPASFWVRLGNGSPGSGDFTILLGNPAQPQNLRAVTGQLSPQGTIALDLPATLPIGQYPLQFNYRGSNAQIATVTIK